MYEEIGGYFELGGFTNSEYHNKAIAINTARNCLVYIIKSRKIKKLYIPYYLCDSVNVALKYCDIEYYNINNKFLPDFKKELEEKEYIYIVNYFGLLSNTNIVALKEKHKNIIIDNVQAFFQKPVDNIDTIYSCRKFFGVPDGAYLYTNKRLKDTLEKDQSKDRFEHILGRLEIGAEEYFKEYKNNEQLLNDLPLRQMSTITQLILNSLDYEKIKSIRTKNFKYLNSRLKELNKLSLKNIEGAFMYPLYIKEPSKVRDTLIKNKIYVPILWPNVLKENNKNNLAYEYASNILPLPCDQRYSYLEMDKTISVIKSLLD